MTRRKKTPIAARILGAVAGPTGLTCSGLILICGSIAGNALFLQSNPHPSPLFASHAGWPEAHATGEPGDLIVQAVQQSLREAGLFAGPVDGVAGPQTRAAILRFERQTGLPERGQATPDLLEALETWVDGNSQSIAPAPAAEPIQPVVPESADPEVLRVQTALARAAYGPLNVDGVFGAQTRDAIARFQLDQGMAITGKIDESLVRRLDSLGAFDGV